MFLQLLVLIVVILLIDSITSTFFGVGLHLLAASWNFVLDCVLAVMDGIKPPLTITEESRARVSGTDFLCEIEQCAQKRLAEARVRGVSGDERRKWFEDLFMERIALALAGDPNPNMYTEDELREFATAHAAEIQDALAQVLNYLATLESGETSEME